MESPLGDLQTKLAEAEGREQAFQVVIANNALETAGLHEIDESINEQGEIQPEFLGNVNRLRVIASGANWPEALKEDLPALLVTLGNLSAAISADDATATGPLAAQAHEQQNELSHKVGEWLAEIVPGLAIEEETSRTPNLAN
ncbi:MAG TPA: hypothetical protein VJ768_05595 [Anaerolineales bacterium]|nr:hypothetical protein [Anaerolineales bacterium]